MRLFIGYSSALYFWLRGSQGLWACEPSHATSLSRCAYNIGDVASFALPRDAFGPGPLHIMVDNPSKRRKTVDPCYHVWTKPLARGGLVPIGHDVFVASPALSFLQMASNLSFFELAELGYELCGGYSRTPGIEPGFIQRYYTLATPDAITRFITKLSYAPGSEKALRALQRVMPNSKSPAESDMAIKTVFSPLQGGYGLPMAELNPEIPLTDEAASIAHKTSLYPDELWRKAKVCLEYDSKLHHEKASDRTRDSLKRNALGCMGYKVITVTPSQLQSVNEFDGIALEVARYLKKRIRPATQKVVQSRYELNEAIRKRIRDDLTPTQWPYV